MILKSTLTSTLNAPYSKLTPLLSDLSPTLHVLRVATLDPQFVLTDATSIVGAMHCQNSSYLQACNKCPGEGAYCEYTWCSCCSL